MRWGVAVAAVVGFACGPKASAVAVEEPRKAGSGTGTGTGTGAEGDAGEAKDPLATAVERIVTLYEEIGRLPAAGSCPETAATIERWTVERRDAIVQVRDAAQGEQAALVDGLFHDASPRLAAALARLSAGTETQP